MTNKEVIEMVYKAKMIKPYAKVHFPYSVEHVERILGITFNDGDKADMQRFFDTAKFYASYNTEDYHCDNQLYHVILSMIWGHQHSKLNPSLKQDFFSVEEADLIYRSISKACPVKVYMSDVRNYRFGGQNKLWTISSKETYIFDLDYRLIRRQINLDKLVGDEVDDLNLLGKKLYD